MRILAYSQLLESYRSLTLDSLSGAFGVSVDFVDTCVLLTLHLHRPFIPSSFFSDIIFIALHRHPDRLLILHRPLATPDADPTHAVSFPV